MGHCFSHLTKADRYKIEALLNNGHSAKEIAAEIHVHISTIYREVKRARMVHRNSDWTEEERYNPDEAHRRYRENLSAKGAPLKIGRDYALAEYLERKVLEEGRSPAAALADIALEGLEFKTTICTSTFYGYITKGVFLMLTNKDLPEKAKRKRKYRKVKTAKRAPRGKSIEKRPAEVEGRLRLVSERGNAPASTAASTGEQGVQNEDGLIRSGDLVVDTNGYTASLHGHPIDLAYKEFELLKYLVQHPGRVFTRAQLLQEVWGYDYYGGTRTVDVHIRRLRAKLGGEYEHLIGTVRNVGYRFDPPEEDEHEAAAKDAAHGESGES